MKSEVFNEDCIAGMKRYPDKHFDLAIVGYNKIRFGYCYIKVFYYLCIKLKL